MIFYILTSVIPLAKEYLEAKAGIYYRGLLPTLPNISRRYIYIR